MKKWGASSVLLVVMALVLWLAPTYAQDAADLPERWSSVDIGPVGVAGSASEIDGTWTVAGAGNDVWDTADEFHFTYRPWSGDVVFIARLASVDGSRGNIGVMIRESLEPGAKHAFAMVVEGRGTRFKRRTETGGITSNRTGGGEGAPIWLKIVRSGDTLTGYYSSDGEAWTEIDSDTVSMNTDVYVGLAVASQNNESVLPVTFDNVSLE